MKKKYKKKLKKLIAQIGGCLVALSLISTGILSLIKGYPAYKNWFGELVFAPIAIIIGIFLLYLIAFKWEKMANMK